MTERDERPRVKGRVLSHGPALSILAVHSYYRQQGGEDVSFTTDVALLRASGHRVVTLTASNRDLDRQGPVRRAANAVWNSARADDVGQAIAAAAPDIVLVNNLFPGLSGSVLRAAADAGVPTLIAVRNYRLACIAGTLFRDGGPCETCLSPAARPLALTRRCYRGGVAESAVALASQAVTRRYLRAPTTYFAPVSGHVGVFLRELGVPAGRIFVRPNTVLPVPAPGTAADDVVFAGRFEPEKGVLEAMEAFRRSRRPGDRMTVIGGGSLRATVAARSGAGIEVCPPSPHQAVLARLARARMTIVPSLWPEPFGRVAVESLAQGTPVVVAARGGLSEIPEHGVSGLITEPTSVAGLTAAVDEMLHEPYWAADGRDRARERFEAHFSPSIVAKRFDETFAAILGRRGADGAAQPADPADPADPAGELGAGAAAS